jgi:hypothetical protein
MQIQVWLRIHRILEIPFAFGRCDQFHHTGLFSDLVLETVVHKAFSFRKIPSLIKFESAIQPVAWSFQ